MEDTLGDRIKSYEAQESDRRFMPLLPICARLDGRSFSTFTKGMKRPYDVNFSRLMIDTTKRLVEETNAKIGYTQSDEISLVFYSDKVESQVFFDGRIQKMTSILASMCSVYFKFFMNCKLSRMTHDFNFPSKADEVVTQEDFNLWCDKSVKHPIFDCRVWTVPNQMEACNTLLWRENDATKNSITMAAREFYSDKELFGKNGSEKKEMMFQKGQNWNDYPDFFKRGTYIQRKTVVNKFTTEELEKLPPKHDARKNPDLTFFRSEVNEISMPPFSKVTNRVGVVFNGEEPVEGGIK